MRNYKLFLTLVLGCLLSVVIFTNINAQTYNGSLNLTTQAEVDAFNYTEVTDLLNIYGSDITDLSPLSNLVSVGGQLIIYDNTSLTTINGFSSLTTAGEILINTNPVLQSFSDFHSLVSTSGGNIEISNNASLTSFSGFEVLQTVGWSFDISYNTVLTQIPDYPLLHSIASSFFMYDNPLLTEITGFNTLQSVGYSFVINGNNALAEFCGLYNFFNYNNGVYHGTGTFDISGNLINPSIQDIIDGGACVPLPVELTAFSGKVIENIVELSWHTATEVNNYGFEIERASSSTTPIREWQKIGFVPGNGNSNSPKEYSLTDKNPNGGSKFVYRLKQIDSDGKFEYSDEVEVELVPNEFALYQNYPNPFNPSTVISYSIPTASNVKIEIFDITGENVATLVDGFKSEGSYEVSFNANGLPSGLYLYSISAGAFLQTRKMILMK